MPANKATQSVIKATRILYAVAGSEHGRTVHQIALALGLKPKTAHRLIRTLEQEKFLKRRTSPLRFLLGPAVTELEKLNGERHLLSVAGDILVRTQSKLLCANFILLELDGTEIYHRLCVLADRPGVLIKQRSYTIDFYSHASSILFLAYAPPELKDQIYKAHPFDLEGKSIWRSMTKLNDTLAEIRRLGWALLPDSYGDYYRFAVPIFSPGGEVIAAIGGYMSIEESATSRKLLIQLCRSAVKEITKQMLKVDSE